MKTIVILADGMADYPIDKLNGKTPLMAAHTPAIDRLCARSRCGRLVTVPDDMPPGSEVANLAVLGYDAKAVYQGRGVLEAASIGVELAADDLAMRCNIICIENDKIKNHSAGHISSEESLRLIEALNQELAAPNIRFHPGFSYRHLLVIKDGKNDFECTPPHDVPGTLFREVLPRPKGKSSKTAGLLTDLIIRSQTILSSHPVNVRRRAQGKDMGNSIWPWSPGHRPQMKTFQELYGLRGAVISAVDLIFGLGVYAGFKPIKVPGATGLFDTNYEGKAQAACQALRDFDFVFLHIEASDEAGHEGNAELKVGTIQALDQRIIKPIVECTAAMKEPVTIALLPDHATPCAVRTHTRDAVPFLICRPGEEPDPISEFNEETCKKGSYGLLHGAEFMKALLRLA
ncbi:MAG: cofactor-independent phosphoglycerate mutase [Candidatus Aminicenantes bacterium]|nr:cofactor-independent phosphoglycerate mutase [Candidatus Aminicenantes bacterium]